MQKYKSGHILRWDTECANSPSCQVAAAAAGWLDLDKTLVQPKWWWQTGAPWTRGCSLSVHEPRQAGLAENNHVPQQSWVCQEPQTAARRGDFYPQHTHLHLYKTTGSSVCHSTRCAQSQKGFEPELQRCVTKTERAGSFQACTGTQQQHAFFTVLPSFPTMEKKSQKPKDFFTRKSGRALEQAAQDSSGVAKR